jgi:hypothetical protein
MNIVSEKPFLNIPSSNNIKDGYNIIYSWKKTKLLYPNADIGNNIISDNIYWIFSENESYTYHLKSVNFVINDIINKEKNNIIFKQYDYNKISNEKYLLKLKNHCDDYIIYDDYIFIKKNNIIVILDLELGHFYEINKEIITNIFNLDDCCKYNNYDYNSLTPYGIYLNDLDKMILSNIFIDKNQSTN